MSNTLYTQLVHLLAIVAVATLMGLGKLETSTGMAFLGALVGIALPSPFATAKPPPAA